MPYLRTTRNFPEEAHQLTVEVNRSYVDIAQAVNLRTIGIFPTNNPAVTGNSYFLSTQRNQSLRQLYTFGAIASGATLTIPHNIVDFTQFAFIGGTCITALPDYRPIPYASINLITDQIDIRIDKTTKRIVIINGSSAPAIISGIVILEWLSQV